MRELPLPNLAPILQPMDTSARLHTLLAFPRGLLLLLPLLHLPLLLLFSALPRSTSFTPRHALRQRMGVAHAVLLFPLRLIPVVFRAARA